MNITHLRRVRRLFVHDMAPRHIQRHNIRAWVRMVRYLGPAWKGLPKPLARLEKETT